MWGEPADTVFPMKSHRTAAKHLTTRLIEDGFDTAYAYRARHPRGAPHAHMHTLLYLDCDDEVLYALVLMVNGEKAIQTDPTEAYIRIDGSGKAVHGNSGNDGTPPDFSWVGGNGTLADGSVFDSSVQRGEPATFPLNGVIPCWTEGLQLMKVGGKSRLVCPAAIAYGDRGAPPRIKPGATLTFEVELLEIATP